MRRRWLPGLLGLLLGAPLLALVAGSGYYAAGGESVCATCHEIEPQVGVWRLSSHRDVPCRECHGSVLTTHLGFHVGNLRRLLTHLRGTLPERVRMKDRDIEAMVGRCAGCHRQEHADWDSGPHGVRFDGIFLDPLHNSSRRLIDDCLRCHGMHFEGGIRDLVAPLDTRGPWRLTSAAWERRPTIPCLACHRVHWAGERLRDLVRTEQGASAQEIHRPSLAFFDRRGMRHVALDDLPLPEMRRSGRRVAASADARQALCYQCHAPLASGEAGSADDRTPVGVHEGLSCLACHSRHGQRARASCAVCHPRLSNCGLDVLAMDTTFRSSDSPHDIHFVACEDCHPAGRPRGKRRATAGAALR